MRGLQEGRHMVCVGGVCDEACVCCSDHEASTQVRGAALLSHWTGVGVGNEGCR
jgi:hypothetical protein